MARRTHPRRQEAHEVAAAGLIRKHESVTGKSVSLPVPVESIVERTAGLAILYEEIPEQGDVMILGALSPSTRQIVLNTEHSELFETVIGPERFTLAHELGHWVYDADDPAQQAMALISASTEVFCYHRDAGPSGLEETTRIREVNANKFASCLLMPDWLMQELDVDGVIDDFARSARDIGVSKQALRIRLETLGLVDDADLFVLDSLF